MTIDSLKFFVIPFTWTMHHTGIVHGIAGWFDIDLNGT